MNANMAGDELTRIVDDLRAEGDALYELLQRLEPEHWASPTTFKSWTVFDVVAHLHISDHMAVTTITPRPSATTAPVVPAPGRARAATPWRR